jgi:D-hydroxyproline dehydrogenase subunit gamma
MHEVITLSVNGLSLSVPAGSLVSSAVFLSDAIAFRRSVTGEARAPLCGMGVCFECRVTINGEAHARSCQIVCQPGMDIRTDD